MKVGDRLMLKPHEFQDDPRNKNLGKKLPCVVTYIHPKRRFFQVRFECEGGGTFRESFFIPQKWRKQ